jgi:tetratricopeptide (TPR) repeat protein
VCLQTRPTTPESKGDLQLEIAYLLLIDIVGYSKLLVNEQIEVLQELKRIVRGTECFRAAEKDGKLIRVPTGDGMALLFFRSPEEPAWCALEIAQNLKNHPQFRVRMGIHSGPVNQVADVNDQVNVAGAGINIAQRIMDCGDAGHILVSKHVADDLAQYREWQPHLHDLGEWEVKHGLRLQIANLYKDDIGNAAVPEKLQRRKRWKRDNWAVARPVGASPWRKLLVPTSLLIIAAIVITTSVLLRGRRSANASPEAEAIPVKSIAVLPFENLSDDKENSYFTDGVQDEILTDLAKVAALKSKLSPEEKAAIEQPPTSDLVAYEYYTRAKALLNTAVFNEHEKEKLYDAVDLLQKAVARDSAFLLAYCQLAWAHDRLYILGIDHTPSRLDLADSAVKAALQLRPNSGEAHLALAAHAYNGYLDYDRARQELDLARRVLPNEPLVFELTGYIDRRQGRWAEAIKNLGRAVELDPRNFFILQQISLACEDMRRFPEMIASLDRALVLVPNDAATRVERAMADLESHADTKPLHSTIDAVTKGRPDVMPGIAESWLLLALCERDRTAAKDALAVMTADGCRNEGVPFPKGWCEGVAARARKDDAAAHRAFKTARAELERIVNDQPGYAGALCVLGLIDAGLGNKSAAIREGRRAVELLPVTKDAINGALLIEYLAIIYAWTGEEDRALEQLTIATRIPNDVNYGQLKLHPYWDPLRGDPRFEKIVNSLAPK